MFTMSRRKPRWGSESESFLLETYRVHEELWNPKHKDYYDRDVRDRTLQQLSLKFGHDYSGVQYTVRDIKEKLKNLRATFGRELHKIIASKKASGSNRKIYVPRWRHFNRMLFLTTSRKARPVLKLDGSEDVLDSPDGTSQMDMFCNIEIEEGDPTDLMHDGHLHHGTSAEEPTSHSEKLMAEDTIALTAEALEPSLEHGVDREQTTGHRTRAYDPLQRIVKKYRKIAPAVTPVKMSPAVPQDCLMNSIGSQNGTVMAVGSQNVTVTHVEDAEFHFCMSMAENLRKLNPFQRETAKIEIQKIMMKFMFPYAETGD